MSRKHLALIEIAVSFILITILFINLVSAQITASQWSSAEIISSESTSYAYRASLMVDDSGAVHIAWKDRSDYHNSGMDWDIFYRYKTVNGSWTDAEVVSNESYGECSCLCLVVDDFKTVHIAWLENSDYHNSGMDWDIFYKHKPVNGSWTETQLISKESTDFCSCPTLTVDGKGTIHVAWADKTMLEQNDTDSDIFYKYKPVNGSWTDAEVVSLESHEDSIDPMIIVDDASTVHIVWEEKTQSNISDYDYDIFYANRSLNDTWSSAEIVSKESTDVSVDPSVAVDSKQTVHVLWNDKTNLHDSGGDYDVFYRFKPKGGKWSSVEVVSDDSNCNCKWPFMIVDMADTIHVAWADQTLYGTCGNDYDIIYTAKKEPNEWLPIEVVSTESIYDSNWPRFDVDLNETVHMSWWDDTEDQWVTFYKYRDKNNFDGFDNTEKSNETPDFTYITIFIAILLFIIQKRRYKQK